MICFDCGLVSKVYPFSVSSLTLRIRETLTPSRWHKFWLLCPLFSNLGLLDFILESSAKPQHFQEFQSLVIGLALDSMGHYEADHDKMPKSVQKS
jgi:hypothetical protein